MSTVTTRGRPSSEGGTELAGELGGRYIFGDNVQRKIWMLDETVSPPCKVLLAIMPAGRGPNSGSDYTGLSSFGEGQNRELYLCQMSSIGGHIYKLAMAALRDWINRLAE